MKTVAARGTVIDAEINSGAALRTIGSNGISQKEIKNKANRIGDDNDDKCPQCPAHPTSAGIPIYITDQQRKEGQKGRWNKRDYNPHDLRIRIPFMRPYEPKEANRNHKKDDNCQDICPCWYDRDLLPDSGLFSSYHYRLRIHHAPQFNAAPRFVTCRQPATAATTLAGMNHHIRKTICHTVSGTWIKVPNQAKAAHTNGVVSSVHTLEVAAAIQSGAAVSCFDRRSTARW
jgi:hypothetical protein